MESPIQKLLREGIAAAKAGQKKQAQQLLLQVTDLDEANLLAWLWLSGVVESRTEQEICLENVLTIDPQHQVAQQALARLRRQPSPRSTTAYSQPVPPSVPAHAGSAGRVHPASLQPQLTTSLAGERVADQAQPAPAKRVETPCPFCQEPVSSMATACPHCQLPLAVNCPTCGAAVDVEQASCASCGYALGNYRQPEAYFSALAAAYQQHRRFEEAVKAWQVIANLNPAYPHVYLYLGESHVGSGRPDRAIRTFEQALTQNPNSAPGHFALAELLRQQGERETAYPHYLKVTELEPGHGLAWLRLGQLYQQVNRRKEANQAYQRASKLLAQESVEGQQALQQLIHLRRELPATLVTGWSELLRQMTGPVVICLLVVLLDSGLRPWWIPWTGWLALLLGLIGAFLSISGTSLPRNPLMCLLAGEQGVSAPGLRVPVVLVGICCWLIALGLILLPLGTQAYPEIPPLPS